MDRLELAMLLVGTAVLVVVVAEIMLGSMALISHMLGGSPFG